MVLLFVDQPAHQHCQHRVEQQQQMERRRRNLRLQHHKPDVFNDAIHRVAQEKALNRRRIAVHGIENRRHIHQKHGEHVIQIRNILEKHKQRRQDQPDANIKNGQAADRIKQRQKLPRKLHAVYRGKDKEHQQRQPEIDDGRHIFGQQEHILGNVDLGKDMRVRHQGVHAAGGGLSEKGEDQVACKQVGGVVLNFFSKKVSENNSHHK